MVEASDVCFARSFFGKQGDFICVKRTDADAGWSMNLAVECYADYFTEDLTALASGKWKLPMLNKVWDQVHQLTLLPGMEMGRCGFEHFLLPSLNRLTDSFKLISAPKRYKHVQTMSAAANQLRLPLKGELFDTVQKGFQLVDQVIMWMVEGRLHFLVLHGTEVCTVAVIPVSIYILIFIAFALWRQKS